MEVLKTMINGNQLCSKNTDPTRQGMLFNMITKDEGKPNSAIHDGTISVNQLYIVK